MILFGVFSQILRGFDGIKVVCVRYNLFRPYSCEIAALVSITISHDLNAKPSSMNRQPLKVRYSAYLERKETIMASTSSG
jgi:hypothetical protein